MLHAQQNLLVSCHKNNFVSALSLLAYAFFSSTKGLPGPFCPHAHHLASRAALFGLVVLPQTPSNPQTVF